MRRKSWFNILLIFSLIMTSFPTWNHSVVKAAEPEPVEVALPVKKISDYEVDGDIRKEYLKEEFKFKQERYKGPLSKIYKYKPEATYKKDAYDSIFTRFSNVKAKINEDAGEGNIITKIEFLKGNEVVQTQTVGNKQKYEADVALISETVPVQSTDNVSPSGATISFKLVGKKWVMWASSSWMKEEKSQRVTPKKMDSGIDEYPGTFFTHLAHFVRNKDYVSKKYPGIDKFHEEWLDETSPVLTDLNKDALIDKPARVSVERKRDDIQFLYYGKTITNGITYKNTEAKDLKITSLGYAGVYFTQHYITRGYYEPGKELMVYASSYYYTIKSQSYRYPDRIRVYVKPGKPKDDPKDPKCVDERGQEITGKDLEPSVSAVIKADQRGNEQFDVSQGIPTSETLYGNVFTKKYLSQNKFVQITGKCTFEVTVNKTFTLQWDETKTVTDTDGKSTTVTETKTKPQTVTKKYDVERPYSYWMIDKLEVYQIDEARLRNYAFDGGEISISPQNYDPPIYSTEETHGYKAPNPPTSINTSGGVFLGKDASGEEFPEDAEDVVDKVKVKNDTFIFEGAIIMDGSQVEERTPTPGAIKPATQIDKDVLYSTYNMIPNTKVNKANQPSTGTIYYGIMSGNINGGEDKEFPINGINPVTVHTPVVLYADVSDDQAHNQKTVPAQNRQAIILERPFTVYLPNSGQHTNYKGYGSRDYGKYIRNKQVKFPFDVYDVFRTTFYPKGTWIDVASYEEEVEFYLPVWVDEGFYHVEMRTIAENAPEVTLPQQEQDANLNLIHHIAYDTVPVDVIGRLYDFHVTDIADYNWETVFRMKQGSPLHTGRTYWVGLQDIDGESRYDLAARYTLPIRPGSHPVYKNLVTKAGYHFKFELKTKGNMFGKEDGITIQPTFAFISASTGERTPVDLYYHSNQASFIKIGSKEDTESKYVILNERLRNVPQVELEDTALYQYDHVKTFAEVSGISRAGYVQNYKTTTTKLKTPVGGYNGLYLTAPIRTLIGPKEELPESVDDYRANAAIQKWYGEYSLPADVYAVKAGTNIAEYGRTHQGLTNASPIFMKDGYIVVNFDISSVQKGQKNAPHLQYIHGKLMNQWAGMEGFKTENIIDPYGRKLELKDGDVLFYDAKYSSRDDFIPTVTH